MRPSIILIIKIILIPILTVALAPAALAQPKKAPDKPAGGTTVKATVKVTDGGKSITDATVVVYLVPKTAPATPEKVEPKTAQIRQVKRTFAPELLAITQGDSVTFPNDDDGFHNVFSPKPKFDLGTLPKGKNDKKPHTFSQPGVVDVYCNIHPEMAATILVLPNRYHTSKATNGVYELTGVPPGTYDLFAYTRRAKPVKATITVDKEPISKELPLVRGPDVAHNNKYGAKYTGGKVYP